MAAYEGFWEQVKLSNTVNVLAAIKGKQWVERSCGDGWWSLIGALTIHHHHLSILWRLDVHAVLCGVTYSSDGGLFAISSRWMSHICTKKDHWLLEYQRPGESEQVKFSTKKGYVPILMGVTDLHIDSVQDFMISIFTNLPCGRRMLLTPPNLTLIFRQRLERVWGVVFWTFFTCTHCVAMPSTVSPTRFTSAATPSRTIKKY